MPKYETNTVIKKRNDNKVWIKLNSISEFPDQPCGPSQFFPDRCSQLITGDIVNKITFPLKPDHPQTAYKDTPFCSCDPYLHLDPVTLIVVVFIQSCGHKTK